MKKFSRIYIEITNTCNLSCSFCIGNTRPPQFMSTEEFSHIINEIKPYTSYIYLHILGEPLLHPNLLEILQISEKHNIKVNITTNGTLLHKAENILLNSPALRKISISLHSMEQNSPYSMTDYLENVISFVNKATLANVFCELRLWNLGDELIDNTSCFSQLCSLLNLNIETKKETLANIKFSGNTKIGDKLYLGTAEKFSWPSMNAPYNDMPIFCHGLRSQIGILCDGTVVPCCLDSCGNIALGNIFTTPIFTIIHSVRAESLYNSFSNRNPTEELCHRCGFATRF